jgi:cytoskeletal protein CcmA (bactofilin family)
MWKKSEPVEPRSQPAAAPQAQSGFAQRNSGTQSGSSATIGPTVSIKGNLTSEEDLLMEGQLEGKIEIRQHSITVGKKGQIKADIYGKVITIEGKVEGNLYGEDQLIVRQSGTVRGNIVAPRVVLEDGSNFKGSIDMSPKEKPAVAAAPEKPVIGMKAT